jgi:hypothetical protein
MPRTKDWVVGGDLKAIATVKYGLIEAWDVSGVTDFDGAFADAISFTANLATWDVAMATTLARMFYKAAAFNTNVARWNVATAYPPVAWTKLTSLAATASTWWSNTAKKPRMAPRKPESTPRVILVLAALLAAVAGGAWLAPRRRCCARRKLRQGQNHDPSLCSPPRPPPTPSTTTPKMRACFRYHRRGPSKSRVGARRLLGAGARLLVAVLILTVVPVKSLDPLPNGAAFQTAAKGEVLSVCVVYLCPARTALLFILPHCSL